MTIERNLSKISYGNKVIGIIGVSGMGVLSGIFVILSFYYNEHFWLLFLIGTSSFVLYCFVESLKSYIMISNDYFLIERVFGKSTKKRLNDCESIGRMPFFPIMYQIRFKDGSGYNFQGKSLKSVRKTVDLFLDRQ